MVLLGLTNNHDLRDVSVDISNNDLRVNGASVLEACVGYLHNVTSLDISNNGMYKFWKYTQLFYYVWNSKVDATLLDYI